ncbi:9014_t:CDS:2 [Dentiscutata erythropus]|uniref:9014_t:CDS:1 n=1 Tax=Dentiscutata erythropus TaxID=1348616 RepID=A0A9N8VXU0_9GLOM|nr:9014_t:CDS:2 [Dentiscutata erythropus]
MTPTVKNIKPGWQFDISLAADINLCLIGYLGAKLEIITTNTQQDLANLTIKIFMPCFLFSNIVSSITIGRLISLWPIPAFFTVFTLISTILGLIGGKLIRLNCADIKFVITGIIFNNVTSLFLGLLKGIENTSAVLILSWKENESPKHIVKRGTSYVLLATLWTNLLRWSLGAYLLKKAPEKDEEVIPQNSPSTSNQFQANNDQVEITPLLGIHPISNIKTFLTLKFMNPPLYAALLALFFIAIPKLNALLIDKDAPLMAVYQAIDYIGSIAIPLTLLTLGAELYNLPRSHKEHMVSMITYVLTCRYIIMPVIGILLVLYTTSYYINDPMLWFVLILLASGPTAISCVNLAQLANNYQEEFSALLFYSYILATPFVTLVVVFVLYYIERYQ